MALSKKQKSGLLVAILTGGLIIGEGIGLYNLNENLKELHTQNNKLNNTVKSLGETLTERQNNIKELNKEKEDLNKQKDDLTKSIEDLKKENESLKKDLEAKKQKEASAKLASADYPTQSVSRGSIKRGTPVKMTLTFYGDFAHENGGYTGIDAQGNKLVAGTVASNVYSFGTKFELNGQIFTVRDRGGRNFNSSNRLDVFVPRKSGESNSAYAKRIREYGRKTVTMHKL